MTTETLLFRGATAVALLHAIDDAWLDRQPGGRARTARARRDDLPRRRDRCGRRLPTAADPVAAEDRRLKVVVADSATGGSFAEESPGEPLEDTVAKISPTPLLLIATGRNLPAERDFNRIYAEAAREPVELWELPNVDHTAAIRRSS